MPRKSKFKRRNTIIFVIFAAAAVVGIVLKIISHVGDKV